MRYYLGVCKALAPISMGDTALGNRAKNISPLPIGGKFPSPAMPLAHRLTWFRCP
jgi:hypothetical protein